VFKAEEKTARPEGFMTELNNGKSIRKLEFIMKNG